MPARQGIRIDSREFSTLLNDAKDFDRDLGLRLRRNIREAAKPLVEQMQSTVTAEGGKRSANIRLKKRKQRSGEEYEVRTNTRSLVAKGISFRVSTGKNGGAGTFVSSSKNLPADRKPMQRAFNKARGWRHPVFGNREEWVQQYGRPYFGSVILDNQGVIRDAVEEALNEAAAALGRRRIR